MYQFLSLIELLASIATSLALIVAIIELAITIQKNSQDKKHDKRKDTLDAYRELQKEVFDVLCVKYSQKRIAEIADHYRRKENIEDYTILSTYTAKIEHFCVGVEKEIYDWETVYELAHGFLDGKIRRWMAPLMERKASFFNYDPYENTKKVLDKMDRETKKRKERTK